MRLELRTAQCPCGAPRLPGTPPLKPTAVRCSGGRLTPGCQPTTATSLPAVPHTGSGCCCGGAGSPPPVSGPSARAFLLRAADWSHSSVLRSLAACAAVVVVVRGSESLTAVVSLSSPLVRSPAHFALSRSLPPLSRCLSLCRGADPAVTTPPQSSPLWHAITHRPRL